MSAGKSLRMKRLIDPHRVALLCALDHGTTSPRFLEPLTDIAQRTREAIAGGANAIMIGCCGSRARPSTPTRRCA